MVPILTASFGGFMIYINKKAKTPLYEQIYNCIRDEIFTGALAAFSKLPPTRQLASDLNVSRNTVEAAYQQLVAEGYITSHIGSGHMVNQLANQIYKNTKAQTSPNDYDRHKTGRTGVKYDFWYPLIRMQNFPHKDWKKAMTDAMYRLESREYIAYPERTGYYALREVLANYLYKSRGVSCEPNQVIFGCGIQYNLDMVLKLFDPKICNVGIEDPGYDGVKGVFAANHFRMVPIPVRKNGIDTQFLKKTKVELLYITPSHQFPTGTTLPLGKRLEVLDWANKNDAFMIEDDYDSELQYLSAPIPSLQSLDKHGRVIYVGTFSKSLSSSLRISYIVLPKQLCQPYLEKCGSYLCQVPLLNQYALADFIKNGYYSRHLNKLRNIYGKKHDSFLAAIKQVFDDKIKVSGKSIGLHFLVDIDTELTQQELAERALAKKVKVYTTAPYYLDNSNIPPHQLLLGYGGIENSDYVKALTLLYEAWF